MSDLPAPILETLAGFHVVRDDRLAGGTKRRALAALLREPAEYVYASPAYGYAQIALAHAARAIGGSATIFTAKRATPHARTREAMRAGAKVLMVPHGYLSHVQAQARAYAATVGASLLPFGVDTPEAITALAAAAAALSIQPAEVWCAAGSGTLARALQLAWPTAQLCIVQVGRNVAVPGARRYVAPERFEDDAKELPPIPSCRNYDAKVWQFLRRHGAPGALAA